ncbi:MAG: C_GCAxxG_C_C family protein [Candidatus Aminicenantes bacterium]|nr:C_GCAxxG_C_C family protein [Candidatus Aminicenantes bacterium]
MKKLSEMALSRRNFMGFLPGMLAGTNMLVKPRVLSLWVQKEPELKEELTPEELKIVEKSSMAKDLANYFGKDFSCAESLFMVSLRYLKKPEEFVWAASGFGGGLYHKDLCGFLTSGIMAIGLSSGMKDPDRKIAKARCGMLVKEYWKWWRSVAPLHCAEIRKEGTSSKVCGRLGRLAAAKTQELLDS